MTRNVGNFVENQFAKGLISEATGFNFPEQAVTETWDCRFLKTGEVQRRLGFNYEGGVSGVVAPNVFASGVQKSFLWKDVGTNGNLIFLVYQTGFRIIFFQADSSGNFSTGLKSFYLNLQNYKASDQRGNILEKECTFAYGDGKLFICHPYCDPIYVKYTDSTGTITTTRITLKIRDIDGLKDSLGVSERPTTLSTNHKYNLHNQGWGKSVPGKDGLSQDQLPWKLIFRFSHRYPNNCDMWWIAKDANGNVNYEQFKQNSVSNSEAPKGHFILDAFYQDRHKAFLADQYTDQEKTGIGNINVVTSQGQRPSCVAFFAGRVWYAGVAADKFFNNVYYSQIVTKEDKIGLCYQQNDPTSEHLSDLLETDGGVVKVAGVAKITSLFVAGNSLLVFGTNGIWSISGSGAEGTGFNATDFSINKISSIGLLQSTSLLDVEGSPMWWNSDGIWSIQRGQNGVQVISLTDNTIKQFIQDYIPIGSRAFIQASYNPLQKTIQWMYRSTAPANIGQSYTYDRILELNTLTGAFYPFTIGSKKLCTFFCASDIRAQTNTDDTLVNDAGIDVVTGGAVAITQGNVTLLPFVSAKYKYITIDGVTNMAFVEENATTYKDFTGTDYTSYFITGAKIHGEGNKNFNLEYITVFTKQISNDGSAYLRTKWDWSNSAVSGKWSAAQQVYSTKTYRDVLHKKLLIRGFGPAVQLYFYSVTGKPFSILGWSSFESVDVIP